VIFAVLAPLITGIIARGEAIVRFSSSARNASTAAITYDIVKLLQKETVLPAPAGPVFRAAPCVNFRGVRDDPALIGADHVRPGSATGSSRTPRALTLRRGAEHRPHRRGQHHSPSATA